MAVVRNRTWQIILLIAAVVLFFGWILSGHLISGLAALVLLLAMAGGALLYRFMGPPRQ